MTSGDTGPIWERTPSAPSGKSVFIVLFVVILAVGMIAPAVAVTENDPITNRLQYGDYDEENTAPGHLFVNGSVTTSAQDLSEGTSHDAIAGYEDDNGDWVPNGEVDEDYADGQFVVNTSYDEDSESGNIYSFRPGHIVDDSYTEFPDKSGRTWTNSSRWTVVTNAANVTISNTTVAADADGVQFDTGTSGDTVSDGQTVFEASYNAWDGELDSDEDKRVFQIAVDVDTLEANANVTIDVEDESGTTKTFVINDGYSVANNNTVIGNGTNDYVKQVKLSTLSGSLDNIESINVTVTADGTTNADADFTISWLDLRKKSKNVLAEQRATTDDNGNDPDSDGDYDEIQTVYNATNDISTHDMGTLDSEYDDATVNDLTYPFRYDVTGLDRRGQEGTYRLAFEDPVNPSYDDLLNLTVSLKLPSAVDLSYSNTETRIVQAWDDARYVSFESASGVADSTNLSQASFGDDSGNLGNAGTTITIDSTTDAGERIVLQLEMEMTGDERTDDIEVGADTDDTETADDEGAPPPEGEGGFWSDPVNWLWGGIATVVGFLGLRRIGIIGGGS